MRIERIDHFVLTVRELGVTCEFYTRVLGMEVIEFGKGRRALRFGAQKINLHPAANGPSLRAANPSVGGGDFCLITRAPMAEVVKHLQDENVEIVAGPDTREDALGAITSVYFRDPDGNLVEVSTYAE